LGILLTIIFGIIFILFSCVLIFLFVYFVMVEMYSFLPIIHIASNAKGIIAIGQTAFGIIAIGQFARGIIVIGQFGIGLINFSMIGTGLFVSFGLISASLGISGGLIGKIITKLKKIVFGSYNIFGIISYSLLFTHFSVFSISILQSFLPSFGEKNSIFSTIIGGVVGIVLEKSLKKIKLAIFNK
jgi:hypothetical protein